MLNILKTESTGRPNLRLAIIRQNYTQANYTFRRNVIVFRIKLHSHRIATLRYWNLTDFCRLLNAQQSTKHGHLMKSTASSHWISRHQILRIFLCCDLVHYCDGILGAMASQITSLTICLLNRLLRRRPKKNIKAPRHWPLWGEFTGTGELPAQKASNAENISIWWRHHGLSVMGSLNVLGNTLKFSQNGFFSSFVVLVMNTLTKLQLVESNELRGHGRRGKYQRIGFSSLGYWHPQAYTSASQSMQ